MRLRPLPLPEQQLRIRARRAFAGALAAGTILRRVACQRCGRRQDPTEPRNSMDGVEAHHADYSKPLEVEWLCHWCHMTADQELRQRLRLQPELSTS